MKVTGRYFGKAFILALMLVGFLNVNSIAQVMSLDDCIETAQKNNYSIFASKNALVSKQGSLYSAWLDNTLPSIYVNVSRARNWHNSSVGNSYYGEITVGQTYGGLGLGTFSNIRQNQHNLQSSRYDLKSTMLDLTLQVKEDYYNVLRAKMLEDVARDAVKRGEERLRIAQSRYDLGSASMSDVLKAKVQYGNDKLDLVTKVNTTKIAMCNLAFTMGIDVNKEYEVADSLPERDIDITYEIALNEALNNNPNYRKSQVDLASAKDGKNIAYSRLLPDLSFGVTHTHGPTSKFSDFKEFRNADADYTAFVLLSFNLFDGFSDYTDIRSSRYNVKTSKENVNNTRNSVSLAVKQAVLDLEEARETRLLSKESVASAQEDLNLVREKYNLGAATILEVLDAEVSLKEAQTNEVQALFDYNLSISRIETAMGRQ